MLKTNEPLRDTLADRSLIVVEFEYNSSILESPDSNFG